MSTKKEAELEELDTLVRRRMIECLKSGATEELGDLNTAVSYLTKNNTVAEKAKSSVEEDIEKRLEDAKKRRGQK